MASLIHRVVVSTSRSAVAAASSAVTTRRCCMSSINWGGSVLPSCKGTTPFTTLSQPWQFKLNLPPLAVGSTRRTFACSPEDGALGSGNRATNDRHATPDDIEARRKVALYAGSFDPPSEGHLDIISRALTLCDKLVVAVAENPNKSHFFSSVDRVQLVETMVGAELPPDMAHRVEVVMFSGLVVEFAESYGVSFLVRGLRAYSDFEYEFRMALVNRKLTGVETSFLMADERMSYVSSSLIREMAIYGKMLPNFVPKSIEDVVFKRLGVYPPDMPGEGDTGSSQ